MPNQPHGFSYTVVDDEVVITHHTRHATTLRGAAAQRFLADVAHDPQQLMARVTGNYKHGDERAARSHPPNQAR